MRSLNDTTAIRGKALICLYRADYLDEDIKVLLDGLKG